MHQRWYDRNPTLSMAFSLLQNASPDHQKMAVRYVLQLLESLGALSAPQLRSQGGLLRFIFPKARRNGLESHARELVELMKRLPEEHQQTAAVQLIHYIYMLDADMTDPLPPEESTQPERLRGSG